MDELRTMALRLAPFCRCPACTEWLWQLRHPFTASSGCVNRVCQCGVCAARAMTATEIAALTRGVIDAVRYVLGTKPDLLQQRLHITAYWTVQFDDAKHEPSARSMHADKLYGFGEFRKGIRGLSDALFYVIYMDEPVRAAHWHRIFVEQAPGLLRSALLIGDMQWATFSYLTRSP